MALALSWAVALAVYAALAEVPAPAGSAVTPRRGPVRGADLGTVLVLIGAWQVLFYVMPRGCPSRRSGAAHGG